MTGKPRLKQMTDGWWFAIAYWPEPWTVGDGPRRLWCGPYPSAETAYRDGWSMLTIVPAARQCEDVA